MANVERNFPGSLQMGMKLEDSAETYEKETGESKITYTISEDGSADGRTFTCIFTKEMTSTDISAQTAFRKAAKEIVKALQKKEFGQLEGHTIKNIQPKDPKQVEESVRISDSSDGSTNESKSLQELEMDHQSTELAKVVRKVVDVYQQAVPQKDAVVDASTSTDEGTTAVTVKGESVGKTKAPSPPLKMNDKSKENEKIIEGLKTKIEHREKAKKALEEIRSMSASFLSTKGVGKKKHLARTSPKLFKFSESEVEELEQEYQKVCQSGLVDELVGSDDDERVVHFHNFGNHPQRWIDFFNSALKKLEVDIKPMNPEAGHGGTYITKVTIKSNGGKEIKRLFLKPKDAIEAKNYDIIKNLYPEFAKFMPETHGLVEMDGIEYLVMENTRVDSNDKELKQLADIKFAGKLTDEELEALPLSDLGRKDMEEQMENPIYDKDEHRQTRGKEKSRTSLIAQQIGARWAPHFQVSGEKKDRGKNFLTSHKLVGDIADGLDDRQKKVLMDQLDDIKELMENDNFQFIGGSIVIVMKKEIIDGAEIKTPKVYIIDPAHIVMHESQEAEVKKIFSTENNPNLISDCSKNEGAVDCIKKVHYRKARCIAQKASNLKAINMLKLCLEKGSQELNEEVGLLNDSIDRVAFSHQVSGYASEFDKLWNEIQKAKVIKANAVEGDLDED